MRRFRRKFKRPKVSWDTDLIKENKRISSEYGLRRREEILRSQEVLRSFRQRARGLIAEKNAGKEKILMDKLRRIGLLTAEKAGLDDVLALSINNVLDRRLQTIVFRKGLAESPLQARQMIVHGHISINGRRTKFPSYIVNVDEENGIVSLTSKPKPAKRAQEAAKGQAPDAGADEVVATAEPAADAGSGIEEKDENDEPAGEGE